MDSIRSAGLVPVASPQTRAAAPTATVAANGTFAAALAQSLAAGPSPAASQTSAALLEAFAALEEESALTGTGGVSDPFAVMDPSTPSSLPFALDQALVQSGVGASAEANMSFPPLASFPLLTTGGPTVNVPALDFPGTGGTAAGDHASARNRYRAMIAAMAPSYGLDPALVDALVSQESGYDAGATSSAGAMGLMQLMPATAAALGVTEPYDPVSNLRGGMTYLSQLLRQYGDNVTLALAAYNAGPGTVASYGGIPPYPETQAYIQSIMSQLRQQSP